MIWRVGVFWSLGLTWALVVGHFVARSVVNGIRARIVKFRADAGDTSTPLWLTGIGIPPGLTGVIERLFFTVAVAFELSGVATAMMAWIAIKLAADWNRPSTTPDTAGTLSAALGGLVSMLFAVTGGLICRLWRP